MIVIHIIEDDGTGENDDGWEFDVVEDAIHFLIEEFDIQGLDGWIKQGHDTMGNEIT